MQAVAMENRASEETVASHYEKLLGISRPWKVLTAQLDLLRGKVEIEVGWDESEPVTCPECGKACARHDHAPPREWRHLNVMQFLTIIRARVPRCRCPEHGVLTGRTPWAEPGAHFTVHFENFAVQVIARVPLADPSGRFAGTGLGRGATSRGSGRGSWFGAPLHRRAALRGPR